MAELLRNHDTACPAYHTKGRDLEDEPCTCGARVPSARDTAIREAAKLELLEELDAATLRLARQCATMGEATFAAVAELQTKYQSADSQPAQDGERRQ